MNDKTLLPTSLPGAYLIPVFVTEQEESYLLSKIEELGGTPLSEETDAPDGQSSKESPRKFRSKPTGWRDVKGRRSMYWGGSVIKDRLVPLPLPSFMTDQFPRIIDRVADTQAFAHSKAKKPNHILVNEYLPGQGIFPHQDGPAYFPTVATLSLGSHTILDIYEYADDDYGEKEMTDKQIPEKQGSRAYKSEPLMSILLPRRSLFILRQEMYETHLHGISERKADTMEQLKKCINWEEVSSRRSRWEMGDDSDTTTEWPRTRRVSLTMRAVEKLLKNPFMK